VDFRIADTFTESLARLTGEEQKAIKTAAFDLQLNPASPGVKFHKLDKAFENLSRPGCVSTGEPQENWSASRVFRGQNVLRMRVCLVAPLRRQS
jgi:hypothetical protein